MQERYTPLLYVNVGRAGQEWKWWSIEKLSSRKSTNFSEKVLLHFVSLWLNFSACLSNVFGIWVRGGAGGGGEDPLAPHTKGPLGVIGNRLSLFFSGWQPVEWKQLDDDVEIFRGMKIERQVQLSVSLYLWLGPWGKSYLSCSNYKVLTLQF